MKNIFHHGCDESKASTETRNVRWSHPETRNWISTTQVWSWDDGNCDAIVVVTGSVYYPTGHVVIRVGSEIKVIEGSLNTAMRALGFDTGEYRITTEAEASAA